MCDPGVSSRLRQASKLLLGRIEEKRPSAKRPVKNKFVISHSQKWGVTSPDIDANEASYSWPVWQTEAVRDDRYHA